MPDNYAETIEQWRKRVGAGKVFHEQVLWKTRLPHGPHNHVGWCSMDKRLLIKRILIYLTIPDLCDMCIMAINERDDRATYDDDEWFGWGEVRDAECYIEDGLVRSSCEYAFELENSTNSNLAMQFEYSHWLQKKINGVWTNIQQFGRHGGASVPRNASFGHADLGWQRFVTGSHIHNQGEEWRLKCYCLAKKNNNGLRAIKYVECL